MRLNYYYNKDDGYLPSNWKQYKYYEGRFEAYNKLKKKSYSSYKNMQKYLSDSIRDSNKYLNKFEPLSNENVYKKNMCTFLSDRHRL